VNDSGVVEDIPAAEAAVADESDHASLPDGTPTAPGDVPTDMVAPSAPPVAVASPPPEPPDAAPR
jgi:hypothetical protein